MKLSDDFGSKKTFGWLAPRSMAGTAEFGEPDRLRLRRPGRRRAALHPARTVEVRVRPPGPQILVAEDPRLAAAPSAIGVRICAVRSAGAGIEPVEAFAAGDVGLQIGPVVDRGPALGGIGMIEPVAPVRQRHVVVDADEIDLRIGPERIEVKEHVARTVARLVPEVFRPVGGVADLRPGPEDRAARPRAGPDTPAPPDRCWRPSGSSSAPASRCRSGTHRPRPPPRRDGRSAAPCAADPSRRACRSS